MAKPMCQSCGQPLNEELKGTNTDGSKSADYCNLCYEAGSFKQPDITMEQMQQISIGAMQDMHIPKFFASMIAKSQIPKLKRWKQ